MVRVVIIGSGPAGAYSGGLLARLGHSVLVLERAKHPRWHVGESMVTSFPFMLDQLGDKYRRMIFEDNVQFSGSAMQAQTKYGAYITLNGNEGDFVYTHFDWSDKRPVTVQTRRERMDAFLSDAAVDLGAELRCGVAVLDVDIPAKTLRWRDTESGEEGIEVYDFVIDASGFSKVLHPHVFGDNGTHFFHSMDNVAMTSWWQGTALLSDPVRRHGITVDLAKIPDDKRECALPSAWTWFIPVDDENLSVGTVTSRALFSRLRDGRTHKEVHELLLKGVSRGIDALLGPNARETSPFICLPDRSHRSQRTCSAADGWFLAGDAAVFLDPFLSTGVHMAGWGALLAAMSINSLSRGTATTAEVDEFHSRMLLRQFARLQMIVSSVLLHIGHDECTIENIRKDIHVKSWDDVLELALPTLGYSTVADISDERLQTLLDTVFNAWRYFCVSDNGHHDRSGICRSEMLPPLGSSLSDVLSFAAADIVGGFTEYFGDLWAINHVGFFHPNMSTMTFSKMPVWRRAALGSVKLVVRRGLPLAVSGIAAARTVVDLRTVFYRDRFYSYLRWLIVLLVGVLSIALTMVAVI